MLRVEGGWEARWSRTKTKENPSPPYVLLAVLDISTRTLELERGNSKKVKAISDSEGPIGMGSVCFSCLECAFRTQGGDRPDRRKQPLETLPRQ